jgi:hypothetical protein
VGGRIFCLKLHSKTHKLLTIFLWIKCILDNVRISQAAYYFWTSHVIPDIPELHITEFIVKDATTEGPDSGPETFGVAFIYWISEGWI